MSEELQQKLRDQLWEVATDHRARRDVTVVRVHYYI